MPQSLYPFALLACPVGMGLMMWLMMRGNKDQTPQDRVPPKQDDVTRLQDEIDALRAEVGSRRGETTQLRQLSHVSLRPSVGFQALSPSRVRGKSDPDGVRTTGVAGTGEPGCLPAVE